MIHGQQRTGADASRSGEIQDVSVLLGRQRNTDKITDTETYLCTMFHVPSVLCSCGFLDVVIISEIRAQPVVCVVLRPLRSAEFSRSGRGCLWEEQSGYCSAILHPHLMIKLCLPLIIFLCSCHFFFISFTFLLVFFALPNLIGV